MSPLYDSNNTAIKAGNRLVWFDRRLAEERTGIVFNIQGELIVHTFTGSEHLDATFAKASWLLVVCPPLPPKQPLAPLHYQLLA
jgi:hypothetical protein